METLKPEKAGKGSAFRQPRKFTYSLATISILTAVFLLLFSLVVIGFVSVYFQGQFTDQYLDTIGRMESQINSDTEAAFNTLDRQLFQLGAYNTNVSLINTTSDAQVFYQAKMTLYKELTNLAPVFPEIDGLFFYSPSVDDYTPYVARAASYGCSEYVKRFLSDTREDFSRMQNVFKKWQLIRYEDSIYLVRYVYSGSGVLGAWTSVPTLIASFRNILPRESVVSMLDPECHLLQGDLFPDYVFDDISLTHYQSYTAPDGYRYMVNAHRTSYSDCYLIVFTPFSLLQSMLSPVFKNTLSMIGVIALAVLVFSALFKRMIGQPVKSMQQTLRALQDGKQKAPILPTDSRCLEVRQMFHVLNGMLDNIQTLEAQIYEDQLTQSRMELQFLKSQITPHFLINCLNTFSYLASSPDESDHDAAQRLTQTLSQHIRYSFATGDVIPLEQEFDHLDNYLELACIRYPGSLSYELDLPRSCTLACIPPMTLLTLCENTLKHNLIMGEWLKISVSVQAAEIKGRQMIHIGFVDSGTGYPPEALEHCNHILDHPEAVRDGRHIGIYNIVKSIELVFRDEAQVVFSNEPGAGARVDIQIPFLSREPDRCAGPECHEDADGADP